MVSFCLSFYMPKNVAVVYTTLWFNSALFIGCSSPLPPALLLLCSFVVQFEIPLTTCRSMNVVNMDVLHTHEDVSSSLECGCFAFV